ncbi:Uncharacterised protein [Klebsiella pneumoniae]|nr:Uncharacterised protein [Klebsiella pneumoniae]
MMTPPEDSERQQESYLDQHGWQALMQSVSGDPVLCLPRPGHVLHYQGFHFAGTTNQTRSSAAVSASAA